MIVWTRSPDFWWSKDTLAARALGPAALVYGAVAGWKMRKKPGYVAGLPVVCVGNFVAGGAGKTPVALALQDLLGKAGKNVGFLSRGYGGSLAGPVVVDPEQHDALQVGDEPLLLARRATTVVARDRAAGARLLESNAVDVILMDDGFQNPGLGKTRSWVVVDGAVGVGNGRCIPAGPLRAPLDDQLRQTDMVVIVGDGECGEAFAARCKQAQVGVITARLVPSLDGFPVDRPCLAYCGIGRPAKFFDSLTDGGLQVAHRMAFPDHHVISEAEAETLLAQAQAGHQVLVTTEKDWVRMKSAGGAAQIELVRSTRVIEAVCRFDDEHRALQALEQL